MMSSSSYYYYITHLLFSLARSISWALCRSSPATTAKKPSVHLRLRLRKSHRSATTTATRSRLRKSQGKFFRSYCNVFSRTAKAPTQAPHGAAVLCWRKAQEGRLWGGRVELWKELPLIGIGAAMAYVAGQSNNDNRRPSIQGGQSNGNSNVHQGQG